MLCDAAYLVRIVKDSQLMVQLEEGPVCKIAAHQSVSQKPGTQPQCCSGLAMIGTGATALADDMLRHREDGDVPPPFQDQPQLYKICGCKQGRCYEDDEGIFPNGSVKATCTHQQHSNLSPIII